VIEILLVLAIGLVVVAGATLLSARLGIAAPLVLVAVGVVASLLPVFETLTIDPEIILAGILPPLLYSSAVSMPAMNFRREFGAIGGLSLVLVVATSLVLGVFFLLVIPDLGFAWGVALGAIVSPTDAVAISIVKRTSASTRVVAMLEGESLLNDATALVLLRTAIVATAASFSFWGTVGTFAYSVAVAVALGAVVGWFDLRLRRRVTDPTVNTVLSFVVPFAASLPAEALGASGLVAAVVAGIVTGVRAPRVLSPQNRLSDAQNWRTVELVLEGAVFLTMGLQISSIVDAVERDHAGVLPAVLVAAGALALTVLVRAAYVGPLLAVLGARSRRIPQLATRVQGMQERMATPEGRQQAFREVNRGRASPRALEQFARRVTQVLADLDYFRRAPLGWREGTIVVWAGMRGAVTVAAAQTLPADAPQRPVLVLVAFTVALLSLVVQGSSVGPLLRRIASDPDPAARAREREEERTEVLRLLRTRADAIPAPQREGEPTPARFDDEKRYRLAVLGAQREALLDARDTGTFDAEVLEVELANLDAAQIAIEMRSRLG